MSNRISGSVPYFSQNWFSGDSYRVEQVVFADDVNGLGKNDQRSNGQNGNYTLTSGIMNSEIWKKAS